MLTYFCIRINDGSGSIVCKQYNDSVIQKLFFEDYYSDVPYCFPGPVEETDAFDEVGELKSCKSGEVALTEQEEILQCR